MTKVREERKLSNNRDTVDRRRRRDAEERRDAASARLKERREQSAGQPRWLAREIRKDEADKARRVKAAAERERELDERDRAEWLAGLDAARNASALAVAETADRAAEAERAAADRARAVADYFRTPAGRAKLDDHVQAVMDHAGDWTLAQARAHIKTDGRSGKSRFTDPKPVFGAQPDDVAAAIVRRWPVVSLEWFTVYMRVCGCCESRASLRERWKVARGR